MTESEIIDGLLARDETVTREFFFSDSAKSCKPLLMSILAYVFPYPVDYDEAVSEFYAYLMKDDGRKLRQIEERNTLFGWIKVSATRFFIRKRNSREGTQSLETVDIPDYQANDSRSDPSSSINWCIPARYAYPTRSAPSPD
ncbi:MAG: hypothetical protein J5699_03490 [Bacteroidales bacterium]|nr:hypothetical protein [Bacteroidales bacterium]